MPSEKRQKRPRPEPKPDPSHHVADEPVAEPGSQDATVRSPVTETGLSVEEQIRKEWDPKRQGGLPTSAKTGAR